MEKSDFAWLRVDEMLEYLSGGQSVILEFVSGQEDDRVVGCMYLDSNDRWVLVDIDGEANLIAMHQVRRITLG